MTADDNDDLFKEPGTDARPAAPSLRPLVLGCVGAAVALLAVIGGAVVLLHGLTGSELPSGVSLPSMPSMPSLPGLRSAPETPREAVVELARELAESCRGGSKPSRSEVAALAGAAALAKDPRTHSVYATLVTAEGRVEPLWTRRLMPKLKDLKTEGPARTTAGGVTVQPKSHRAADGRRREILLVRAEQALTEGGAGKVVVSIYRQPKAGAKAR